MYHIKNTPPFITHPLLTLCSSLHILLVTKNPGVKSYAFCFQSAVPTTVFWHRSRISKARARAGLRVSKSSSSGSAMVQDLKNRSQKNSISYQPTAATHFFQMFLEPPQELSEVIGLRFLTIPSICQATFSNSMLTSSSKIRPLLHQPKLLRYTNM